MIVKSTHMKLAVLNASYRIWLANCVTDHESNRKDGAGMPSFFDLSGGGLLKGEEEYVQTST